MKLAVVGGTGLVGRLIVDQARRRGHEALPISRASGVDLVTGAGLADRLRGCDAVIDVANIETIKKAAAVDFFTAATGNLVKAGEQAQVNHLVMLSIVGCDRVPFGYYAGKVRQEELVRAGPLPWTILRATQFHEFPGQLLARSRGPVAIVPRMRSATVAAGEVAAHLLDLVAGEPQGMATELAGPEVHAMPGLVRRVNTGRRLVVPVKLPGDVGRLMAGDGLLPQGDSVTGTQTFAEWLGA